MNHTIAGAFAGITGTLLGFPLDTIKTYMQTNKGSSSIAKVASSIYNDHGIVGFYRGFASPLTALTILNMLNFSSYAYFCQLMKISPNSSSTKFEYRYGLAAMCVGPISALISTPFELVKIQMQLNRTTSPAVAAAIGRSNSDNSMKYRNSLIAAVNIVKDYGIKGLYTGHAINTVREMIFLSTYFTTYEHLKVTVSSMIPIYYESISIPLSGGLAGSFGWFVSFPCDCIKGNKQSHLMSVDTNGSNSKSSYAIARELIDRKGIKGLYAGLSPSIARAFIVSSSRFTAYEFALWILHE